MQALIQKIKWDLAAVAIFLVIAMLYCFPQVQGKKYSSGDNMNWQGSAHAAMAYHDSTGKDVLWTNSMFGGMPSYTIYVGASNVNYAGYIQALLQQVGKPAYFFFIAMLCFYLLMRVLGVSNWLSGIGALAYAFSSYNGIIISAGHDTKMLTLGFLPAALAGLLLIFRHRWLAGAAVYGLALALMFSNNHYQVIFYTFIVFGCFGICMLYVAIQKKELKQYFISAAIAVAMTAIGAGPTISSVLTTAEYTNETMRGGASELSGHDKKTNGGLDKEYAFRWSSGIGETFCLMIPYLYGGATYDAADLAPKTLEAVGGNAEALPVYWGEQPSQSGPVFFGAIVCFLFVLGMLVIRSPHKWWVLAACIIGIVLAWGKNLPGVNYFLFDHVPYLNKFRTVEMALVIPQLLFPMLGVWGVSELMKAEMPGKEVLKKLQIAAGITAGLCVLLGVGGSAFFNFTGWRDTQLQPEMLKLLKADRASLAMSSSLKSAFFILAAAALIWAWLNEKVKPDILLIGLGLLTCLELWPVGRSYMAGIGNRNFVEPSEAEAAFEPRPVDKAILRDPDPYYRVLDLTVNTYNDAVPAYYHNLIGGYSPAKMEVYQDLIDRHMSTTFNREVLNMLNTKYVIIPGQRKEPVAVPNTSACGNAWFVDEVKWANTADEEVSSLNAPSLQDTTPVLNAFDPRKTAVMRTTFKSGLGNYVFGKDGSAAIKLSKYGLDDISFHSVNGKDGLAVFSDIYYSKGWKAYVDGKETPIMKANYVLRAIKIPAGDHNITFEFRPASFYNGQKAGLVCSILLLGVCVTALYYAWRHSKPMPDAKQV